MNEIYQFPLKQHIGKNAVPFVVEGDSVQRGSFLAFQEENTLGANIYSSVTGKITKITETSIFVEAADTQTDYL